MYKIEEKECIGCKACESVCLGNCISDGNNYSKSIDSKRCTGCNACVIICPAKCIKKKV